MIATPSPVAQEVPGSHGFPLIGFVSELLEFKRGWRAYYASRQKKHQSTVFRSEVGIKAVTVIDLRGLEVLFDTEQVSKSYGFGPAIPKHDLVGHIVPTVFTNGAEHEDQKRFVLELLRRALPSLITTFTAITASHIERWATAETPFDWGASGDALFSDFLFTWLLGTRPDPADVALFIAEILSPLPFETTPPSMPRLRRARDRLLAVIQGAPRFAEAAELGRSLAGLDEQTTAKQLLFYLCFNAWAGLHGAFRSLLAELTLHPEIQARLRKEIPAALAGEAPDLAALGRMPTLQGVVNETLRLHSPVPFIHGKARKDLVITSGTGTYTVRKGELIQGILLLAMRDPTVFVDPDAFDPDRYSDPSAIQGLVWANGAGTTAPAPGNKVCPGKDVVPVLLQLFAMTLVAGWQWSLAETPRWSDVDLIPANCPVSPLMVTSFKPA